MNEDSRKNIPSELEIQNNELTDEYLDKVSGGDMLCGMYPVYLRRCAVDPLHRWPSTCDACPECGSTKYVHTVLPR